MTNIIYCFEKYHFVYKTINLINQKFYIGKHSTLNIDDGYLGSGKRLSLAIKKYGEENFIREIISFHQTSEEALSAEKQLISHQLVSSENCYNLTFGGGRDWSHINNIPKSNETKHKISKTLKGRIFSEEHKLKIKQNHHNCSGENNSFYGKTHSEETKQKLRQADYSSRRGPNKKHGKAKGKKWYHDKEGNSFMLKSNDPKIELLSLIIGRKK
jgi:group I intron endonuclease